MSQGDGKSIQTIQKDFNKVIASKEEEISRLRDHNQKLLLQIKKEKDKVQCNEKFEEKNRGLKKELSGKDKESFTLKRVNQELLEQLRSVKTEHKNQDNQYDVVKSNYKEELLHLRKLNQDMLIQVKKLKQENKYL